MVAQVQSWGLADPLPALMWLRENSMGDERYKEFDAPRSAALYHLIAEAIRTDFS